MPVCYRSIYRATIGGPSPSHNDFSRLIVFFLFFFGGGGGGGVLCLHGLVRVFHAISNYFGT